MFVSPYNVQFTITDEDIAKKLKHLAIDLEAMLPKQARRGGSTLARLIVEAVIREDRTREILGFEEGETARQADPGVFASGEDGGRLTRRDRWVNVVPGGSKRKPSPRKDAKGKEAEQ